MFNLRRLGVLSCAFSLLLVGDAMGEPPQGKETDPLRPYIVEAIARDFDVSKKKAAQFAALQAEAGDVVSPLRDALGDRFGGVVFDPEEEGFRFMVAEGGSVEAAEKVAEAKGIAAETRVESVAYSQDELAAEQRRVVDELQELVVARKLVSTVDTEKNVVELQVSPRTLDEERATIEGTARASRLSRGSQPAVEVVDGSLADYTAEPQTCAFLGGNPYCNQPLRAGVYIGTYSGYGCSVAFAARNTVSTERYFLTAGHCADQGGGDWWLSIDAGSGASPWEYIGVASLRYFGGNGDGGTLRVVNGRQFWDPWIGFAPYAVVPNVTEYYAINQRTWGYVGMGLCHIGAKTWATYNAGQCGTVTATNAAPPYTNGSGTPIYGLTQTTACGMAGDSGGPWLFNNLAVGVHSGGTNGGACPGAGYVTYYEEVIDLEQTLGLNVIHF